MGQLPAAAVLIDIEGTAIPREFVPAVLLPYAIAQLSGFIERRGDDPAVRAALDEVSRMVPGQAPDVTLAHWALRDAPVPPLHALQGLMWLEGFASGALVDPIFPDVGPSLRRWSRGGLRLATYSADTAVMQRLLFAHAPGGDLSGLFAGFFDTRVGMKAEPDSFSRLAIAMAVPTAEVIYLSSVEAELDAAAAAGMRTCQILRADSRAKPAERHPVAIDFAAAAIVMGLPSAA